MKGALKMADIREIVEKTYKKKGRDANLLEGISFPANKEKIKDHLNRLSPSMGKG